MNWTALSFPMKVRSRPPGVIFANVNATLELFEKDGAPNAYPSRMSIVRMFKRGELFALCKAGLAEAPEVLRYARAGAALRAWTKAIES